mgnify:FL=1
MAPKIDLEETGKNIKKLLQERNLTPRSIQVQFGFSTVTPIYHWMNGRNLPTVDNLLILSYVLDCSMEHILVYES